jgi:aldose 1-epimerase
MIEVRELEGFEALTLGSDAGELEATFVPGAGMVGCSLRHRGEELLGQRGGLPRYVADRSTMGIPPLHP